MKTVLFLGLICCFGCLYAQPAQEEESVKKVIVEFFDAFHAQDSAGLKNTTGSRCILQNISVDREGEVIVSTQTFDGFIRTVTALPQTVDFREKLLSFDIRHDGLMAHVWTPYEFYYNRKLHHTGVNSFVLFKNEEGEWKIIGITNTRKKNISG